MIINKRNFWHGNETSKRFLENLLHSAFDDSKNIQKIDFTSVFINRSMARRVIRKINTKFQPEKRFEISAEWEYGITPPRPSHDLSVWYTGENLRPPHDYDITLSFDLDDFDQRNIYLPYWLTQFGEIPRTNSIGSSRLDELLSPRKIQAEQKFFCAVVLNNPHPIRMRAIRELKKIGRVDIFGRAIGRPVVDKIKLLKNYRFNLCFENDLYPGYVTEKPFESWLAGSVPLYWGNVEDKYLNQKAIVNLSQFNSFLSFVDYIQELENDIEMRQQIINRPILQFKPDIPNIINTMKSLAT